MLFASTTRRLFRSARSSALVALIALGGCSGTFTADMPLTPGATNEKGELDEALQNQRWLRMAESAAMSGDAQTAIGMYTQILNRDSSIIEAWYGLGDLLLKSGQVRGSADAFAQILKRMPDDRQATIGYARAMMTLGRPEAAAAHIEPLLDQFPEDLAILNLLAVIRDLQGDHRGAQALYRRGLLADPESVMLRNNMALSAALSGNYDGAVEFMRPLVEGLNSTRQTRQNFALIHGLGGNFAEAKRLSRIDLDAATTDSNLAYYAALRSMEPSQARSAVLRPSGKNDTDIRSRERTEPIVFGLSTGGDEIELASTPNGSWFVNLGTFPTTDEATKNWMELKTRESELLANLRPLATEPNGPAILTVGPVSGKAEADLICRKLQSNDTDCSAQRL